MKEILEQITDILNIGIALSAEKNHKKLLELILSEARRITRCDAGTLYMLEGNHLVFKILQNDTLKVYESGMGKAINLPPVEVRETSISGYCALHKEVLNISDVYHPEYNGIDFSGPRRYDSITGYKTSSMMVVPLEDHTGTVIGVLQLLNAKNEQNQVVPFAEYFKQVVRSLGSQAAVSINNMRYLKEIDAMLHAFVQVMSTAIDERSPYTANHTCKMAMLAEKFSRYLQGKDISSGRSISEEDIEQLVMSAWLHDIGKIAVPLDIMDKSTRLGDLYGLVKTRLLAIGEQLKVQAVKSALESNGKLQTDAGIKEFLSAVNTIETEMKEICAFLEKVNSPQTFVDDAMREKLQQLASRTWLNEVNEKQPWLLPAELEALSVSRGTLTSKERQHMENHVLITKKMLAQIPFGSKYSAVPKWAAAHHELLDGTGYPEKLMADELPLEVRILTIVDIYDALTAIDRPYKKALSSERAFSILEKMVATGKLDGELVSLFKQSSVWND